MNIQSGSQWDGFRHYGHSGHQKLYNNLDPSEVYTGKFIWTVMCTRSDTHLLVGTKCGMHVISNHGIVGRGVLLDYYSWAINNGKPYDPLTSHSISVSDLKAVAAAQGVEFQIGDILLVRSGYTAKYYELEISDPQRLVEAGNENPSFAGVEQSEEMKEWLHDHYFAAVAGDSPCFEVWPGKDWKLVCDINPPTLANGTLI